MVSPPEALLLVYVSSSSQLASCPSSSSAPINITSTNNNSEQQSHSQDQDQRELVQVDCVSWQLVNATSGDAIHAISAKQVSNEPSKLVEALKEIDSQLAKLKPKGCVVVTSGAQSLRQNLYPAAQVAGVPLSANLFGEYLDLNQAFWGFYGSKGAQSEPLTVNSSSPSLSLPSSSSSCSSASSSLSCSSQSLNASLKGGQPFHASNSSHFYNLVQDLDCMRMACPMTHFDMTMAHHQYQQQNQNQGVHFQYYHHQAIPSFGQHSQHHLMYQPQHHSQDHHHHPHEQTMMLLMGSAYSSQPLGRLFDCSTQPYHHQANHLALESPLCCQDKFTGDCLLEMLEYLRDRQQQQQHRHQESSSARSTSNSNTTSESSAADGREPNVVLRDSSWPSNGSADCRHFCCCCCRENSPPEARRHFALHRADPMATLTQTQPADQSSESETEYESTAQIHIESRSELELELDCSERESKQVQLEHANFDAQLGHQKQEQEQDQDQVQQQQPQLAAKSTNSNSELELELDLSGRKRIECMRFVLLRMISDGYKLINNDTKVEKIKRQLELSLCEPNARAEENTVVRARGLPWQATEQDIANFFAGLNIAKGGVALCLSRQGRRNGEALIRFDSPEHRDLALGRHKHFMGSRYIEVYRASCDDFMGVVAGHNQKAQAFLARQPQVIVRMRGLPFTCTARQVLDFFKTVHGPSSGACRVLGDDEGVMFVRNHDDRPTGDAFVLFESEQIAQRALQKHHQNIGTRYVELFRSTVSEVQQVLNISASVTGAPVVEASKKSTNTTANASAINSQQTQQTKTLENQNQNQTQPRQQHQSRQQQHQQAGASAVATFGASSSIKSATSKDKITSGNLSRQASTYAQAAVGRKELLVRPSTAIQTASTRQRTATEAPKVDPKRAEPTRQQPKSTEITSSPKEVKTINNDNEKDKENDKNNKHHKNKDKQNDTKLEKPKDADILNDLANLKVNDATATDIHETKSSTMSCGGDDSQQQPSSDGIDSPGCASSSSAISSGSTSQPNSLVSAAESSVSSVSVASSIAGSVGTSVDGTAEVESDTTASSTSSAPVVVALDQTKSSSESSLSVAQKPKTPQVLPSSYATNHQSAAQLKHHHHHQYNQNYHHYSQNQHLHNHNRAHNNHAHYGHTHYGQAQQQHHYSHQQQQHYATTYYQHAQHHYAADYHSQQQAGGYHHAAAGHRHSQQQHHHGQYQPMVDHYDAHHYPMGHYPFAAAHYGSSPLPAAAYYAGVSAAITTPQSQPLYTNSMCIWMI